MQLNYFALVENQNSLCVLITQHCTRRFHLNDPQMHTPCWRLVQIKKEEQKTNIKRTIDVCQNNHRCVGLIDDRLNDGTEVIFYYVNGIKQIFVIT